MKNFISKVILVANIFICPFAVNSIDVFASENILSSNDIVVNNDSIGDDTEVRVDNTFVKFMCGNEEVHIYGELSENAVEYIRNNSDIKKAKKIVMENCFTNTNGDVDSIAGLFANCKAHSIELQNVSFKGVKDASNMFYGCEVEEITFKRIDSYELITVSNMFANCRNITYVDLSQFNFNNVKNLSCMFSGCENLINVKFTNNDNSYYINVNTCYVKNIFSGCKNLNNIDMSHFYINNELEGCEGIKQCDMFSDCENLSYIKAPNFNATKGKEIEFILPSENKYVNERTHEFENKSILIYEDCDSIIYEACYKPELKIENSNMLVGESSGLKVDISNNVIIKKCTLEIINKDNGNIFSKDINKEGYVWTAPSAGRRSMRVCVEYYDKETDETYYVFSDSIDINVEINVKVQKLPGALKLKAISNENSHRFEYKFIVHNLKTDQWYKLQDFSEKNEFTWKIVNSDNREFFVDVKDKLTGSLTRHKCDVMETLLTSLM